MHLLFARLIIEGICTAVPVLVVGFHPLEKQRVFEIPTNPNWWWGVARSASLGRLSLFLGTFPKI